MSTDCSSCSYDCARTPADVCPYTDITGIGVIIGYVSTAFIAVAIVVVYYVAIYSPQAYPFLKSDHAREDKHARARFVANPFDKYVLRWAETKFPRNDGEAGEGGDPSWLETVLFKCALSMSDLQIVTGFSILLAGYIQLPCGLSAYHWQVVVYLAWFSSLTHLSCLSVLRSYLYRNPEQRLWRWVAMAVIVGLLTAAIIPTGNFEWFNNPYTDYTDPSGFTPPPATYAICELRRGVSRTSGAYGSMMVSVLLLVLAFLNRVVKLHKSLSIDVALRLRSQASGFGKECLRQVYRWCDDQGNPVSLRRLLVYRPLFATFLACRVSLDLWSSMFLEVWWLMVAFCWGSIRLAYTLRLYGVDTGRDAWTFGQIIPVVLLAAPLISIIEFVSEKEVPRTVKPPDNDTSNANQVAPPSAVHAGTARPLSPEPLRSTPASSADPGPGRRSPRVETLQIAERLRAVPLNGLRDEPDGDFYGSAPWATDMVVYWLWIALSMGIAALLFSGLRYDLYRQFLTTSQLRLTSVLQWSPLVIAWVLLCFTLFVMLIDDVAAQFRQGRSARGEDSSLTAIAAKAAVYIGCSLVYLFFATGAPSLRSPSSPSRVAILALVTPLASLALLLLLVVGNMLARGKVVWQDVLLHFAVYLFFLPTCLEFLVISPISVTSGSNDWLYLVIPPCVYVALSVAYWMLWSAGGLTKRRKRRR